MRVAVVGSGVAGPVLSMLIKQRLGWDTTVFDAAHAIKEVGAGISLAPNGLRVLASLDLSPNLADRVVHEVGEATPITHVMRPDGSTIVRFDSMGQQKHGWPMTGIRRSRLLSTCLAAMQQMDIPLQLGKRLSGIDNLPEQHSSKGGKLASTGPVTLRFEDGSSYQADLVVGCDGLNSRTRAVLKNGSEAPPSYTGKEIIFAVTCDRDQDLIPKGEVQMVYGPPSSTKSGGQHYGAYGLGPDACWFASLERATAAGSQRAGSGGGMGSAGSASDSWGPVTDAAVMQGIQEELRDRFRGWALPQQVLERDVTAMIRVGVYDRDPTRGWVRGPVTLAGDAAAPMPPNLGQGGNKALENAGVLVHCLVRHKDNIPLALQRYEELSSRRAAQLLDYSRQAAAMANLTHPLAIAARNAFLRSVVALNGTLPSDWLWKYDCQAVVEAEAA